MQSLPLTLLILAATSSVFAQNAPPSKDDIAAKVQSITVAYAGWGNEASTPGATLSFQEIGHEGRKRTYHLIVTGLPKTGSYTLLQWPITAQAPAAIMAPTFIDASGVLLCRKDGDVHASDDTVNLTLDNVRGEPARLALVSQNDKTVRALAKITPQPVEVTDKACHLTATYLTGHGELVFVEATGLKSGEAFSLALHSGSKNTSTDGVANAAGVYSATFLPFDPKNQTGKGRAQVKLQTPSCNPSLDFAWGDLLNQ